MEAEQKVDLDGAGCRAEHPQRPLGNISGSSTEMWWSVHLIPKTCSKKLACMGKNLPNQDLECRSNTHKDACISAYMAEGCWQRAHELTWTHSRFMPSRSVSMKQWWWCGSWHGLYHSLTWALADSDIRSNRVTASSTYRADGELNAQTLLLYDSSSIPGWCTSGPPPAISLSTVHKTDLYVQLYL